MVRYLLSEVLQSQGHRVIACEDGADALRTVRLRLGEIDAVVTDSLMPGIDGSKLVAEIRALGSGIPILVVSGSVEEPSCDACDDPGTVHLTKPLSPERLKSELNRLLYGTM